MSFLFIPARAMHSVRQRNGHLRRPSQRVLPWTGVRSDGASPGSCAVAYSAVVCLQESREMPQATANSSVRILFQFCSHCSNVSSLILIYYAQWGLAGNLLMGVLEAHLIAGHIHLHSVLRARRCSATGWLRYTQVYALWCV